MMTLALRDFDAESALASDASNTPDAAPEVPVFTFTEEELGKMLAEARAQGAEQGHADGLAQGKREAGEDHQVQATAALNDMREQLSVFIAQDAQRRTELEGDLVDMVLDICERIMPDFLAAYSIDQVQARLRDTLHIGAGQSTLNLLLSPKTEAALNSDITALAAAESSTTLTLTADATLKDGEARMTWENGFMQYSLDRICDEILTALRDTSEQLKHHRQKV